MMAKAANEELIRAALESQGLVRHLGVQVGVIERGTCTLSLPFAEHLSQHAGIFHGAVYAALVDISTAAAAGTVVEEGHTVLTAEYKLNIVRAVKNATLVCQAEVLKQGRLLTVVEARVYAHIGEGAKLAATALATIANVVDDAGPGAQA
jgi:uncharacterized protein (TIGR00369 family)